MKNYKLLIKTNQYTGNFECELCAYVFGDYNTRTQGLDELFRVEVGEDHELSEMIKSFYDEHGITICEIASNPNNLFIHFERNPKKYLKLIKERCDNFPEAYEKSYEYATKNVKITGFELYEVELKEIKLKI